MRTCSPASATAAMRATCHVVAMPYPGRGHINPMVNLCKLISLKRPDIVFTFVVTEEWYNLIGSYKTIPNFIFRTIPNVVPSEHLRAKDIPGFFEAIQENMEAPFELLLDRIIDDEGLSVDVIIADTYLDWIVRVGNGRKIPVASLMTMSATVFSMFYHSDLLCQNGHFPIELSERGEERVDYIPGIPPTCFADFPTIFHGTAGQTLLPRAIRTVSVVPKAQYLLFTSIYELESQVIDDLKSNFPFPVLTLGPTIPYFELENTSLDDRNDVPSYIEWLNSQPEASVLYVSMGSFLSVSSTQMDEFMAGIFDSNVRCLLVSRGENIVDCSGGDDRRVVVPWCDQMRVLNHPSIGGFWTHCGWNSTLEAVFSGVPILASPIIWDQVPNSKMVMEDWRIGQRVIRGVEGETTVKRHEIRKMVEDFMDSESSEVIEMRRRAKQLKTICQQATTKGGSSDTNLDLFINSIS